MLELNFNPFPQLETKRLLLRRITTEDAPELFMMRSDANVLKYIGRKPAKTLDEVLDLIKIFDEGIEKNEALMWGIAEKENPGKLIGTICFWNMQPHNYRTEMGYLLNPFFWGKGYMKEAIAQLTEYGFSVLHLHSIEARMQSGNHASAAVLEANGFVKEGHLKEDWFFDGRFYDTVIYSRLQNSLPGQ